VSGHFISDNSNWTLQSQLA